MPAFYWDLKPRQITLDEKHPSHRTRQNIATGEIFISFQTTTMNVCEIKFNIPGEIYAFSENNYLYKK